MHIQKINEFLQSTSGNYLEIGIYYGETFFEIAKSNPSKIIHGIDPFVSDGWTGQRKGTTLSEAEEICDQKLLEIDNAVIFKMTSKKFLEGLIDENKLNISIVFIDGSHWEEDVKLDSDLAMKLIGNKPGFIIFDDLHLGGVRAGIKYALEKYPNLTPVKDPKEYLGVGGYYSVNTM